MEIKNNLRQLVAKTGMKHSSHIINDSQTAQKAFAEAIHTVYNTKTHEENKLELRPL